MSHFFFSAYFYLPLYILKYILNISEMPRRRRANEDSYDVGIRRTRRRTSYHDRNDAMTHTSIFDCRFYLTQSLTWLMFSHTIFAAVSTLSVLSKGLFSASCRYLAENIIRMKEIMYFIGTMSYSLGYCMFLELEDRVFYVRRRNRFDLVKNRTIDEMDCRRCYKHTRFFKR